MAKKKSVSKQHASVLNLDKLAPLPTTNDTWEVDFRMIPTSLINSSPEYRGAVIHQRNGTLLAELRIDGKPSPVQIASLLTDAMLRPLAGKPGRPKCLHIQGESKWRKLLPELAELGIEVSVRTNLPKLRKAHAKVLDQVRDAKRAKMIVPNSHQSTVETLFPSIARWIQGGTIEIGEDEQFGFVVRALDCGGLVFEDDTAETLAEAMAALEAGLSQWFEENDS
jgi:hypothetical protein